MVDSLLDQFQKEFDNSVNHLREEFSRMQIGRASAALVEGIHIDAYGTSQPLKAVASISVPDAKTVQIQPWDKSQLGPIEKAIQMSDLQLSPVNDGLCVRLNIPPLTEERRKDLVKVVSRLAEEAKIAVRNSRQKVHDKIKEMEKNKEITEDQMHGGEKKLQERVDKVNQQIDELAKTKEQDVMKV